MNYLVIVISILLSVICVLLALLQHYYFISKIDKKSPIKYDVPVFEDLIPSENDKKVQILYPIQKLSYDDDPHEDDLVLNQLTSVLEPEKVDARNVIDTTKYRGFDSEVYNTLQAAIAFKLSGKTHKALKLFEHAAAIAPENADVLNKYGEFLEQTQRDIVTADEFYFKALTYSPDHQAALVNRKRTAQVVEGLDFDLFRKIDTRNDFLKTRFKLDSFEAVKKQAYYLHIYHTVGIEGNTMTVQQLRYLLETGQVVNGKSIVEHNEVLGLEKAMQYIKYLVKEDYIGVREILGIHRRVMGHVDPLKSGVFRDEKVFVGSHIPPSHELVPSLMESYVEWLNSEEAQSMHPVRYAALAHYKLVDIHPFVDGNGRTSRLIMNLILLKAGYPPVMVLKEQREKYYDTLKTANMGDVRPFVRFVAQCTLQILDMYIYGTRLLSIDGVSENEHQIINY
ncbi:protein adenylyltransferase Fic [Aethina tumida]|uniref:protein adenylyltransferase Fic n=1 Tax=Aethina tumida TaxID=116153 RepID=UPI00096AE8B7|nr:protein adenylyltransferase Fic [Aethina tumida]